MNIGFLHAQFISPSQPCLLHILYVCVLYLRWWSNTQHQQMSCKRTASRTPLQPTLAEYGRQTYECSGCRDLIKPQVAAYLLRYCAQRYNRSLKNCRIWGSVAATLRQGEDLTGRPGRQGMSWTEDNYIYWTWGLFHVPKVVENTALPQRTQ